MILQSGWFTLSPARPTPQKPVTGGAVTNTGAVPDRTAPVVICMEIFSCLVFFRNKFPTKKQSAPGQIVPLCHDARGLLGHCGRTQGTRWESHLCSHPGNQADRGSLPRYPQAPLLAHSIDPFPDTLRSEFRNQRLTEPRAPAYSVLQSQGTTCALLGRHMMRTTRH